MKRLLLIPLLLLSLSLGATKYYVDEGGNNGNDGSSGSPWLTVTYACSQVTTPGDTVYINAGTYAETAQIVKALGVHIHGAGVTSIINSTFAANYTGSINCASTEGNPVNDGGSISYIKLTGDSYTGRIGIYGAYRNNVTVHHCTIEGFTYGAIRIKTNNADVFTAPTVDYATDWSIHNNNINDCGYLNSSYSSVWFDGTDGMEIYNNTFVDTARAPGSNSWATIKCTFNTGYDIHDNTFYRENHEAGRFNFFLENWNYGGDCQFRDNTLYGLANIDLGGMHNQVSAGHTYGMKVYRNQLLNSANGNYTNGDTHTIIGITIEGNGHDEVYVFRNRLQRFGYGIEIATPTASTGGYEYNWSNRDIYIYANIISDCGYLDSQYCYGILFLNETNTDGYTNAADNINILNNTITAMVGSTYQGIRFSGNDTISDVNIKNNIIKNFDSYGIYLGEHSTDGLSMTNVAVTYNCMNGNGTNTVGIDGDIVQTNFDVATGNITTVPLFTSFSTFRPQSASPTINAGTDVGLTRDYYGNVVPSGSAVDIGAVEYGNKLIYFYDGKPMFIGNKAASNVAELDLYCDEYDLVYAAMSDKPHADTATIFNDFVFSLDSAGFWTRAHLIQVYCGGSNSADALINWRDPGTYDGTAVNTPTFTRYRGFDFNGSNQYVNTNFNPFGKIEQDNATGIVYVREETAEAVSAYSAYDGSGNYFYLNPRNASDQVSYRTNQTADEASTEAAWIGCWIATRRGVTEIEVYRAGSSRDTGTDASVAVPDINIYVGRHASSYGTRETSLFMVMDAVSDGEASALNTIIERLMDRLGIGVQ